MENEILKIAVNQGLWAVLFVVLLFFVLNENSKREEKYQDIISKLTDKFNILEDVKKDVEEVKDKIFK